MPRVEKPAPDEAGEEELRVDAAVLALLVHDGGVWTRDELARSITSQGAVEDAVRRLYAAGLVHKLDTRFVVASRAALRAAELDFA